MLQKFSVFIVVFLFFSITVNSQNKKVEKEVSFMIIDEVPVYPGCKGSKQELKNCFSNSIQRLFIENFNSDLPNQLLLKEGKHRIFIGFKITASGDVVNVVVRAPHPKLKEEVKRVMNLSPRMIAGKVKGENVAVKYSIPFTILVEETKAQKKARRKKERMDKKNKN
jgi:protein TonB